MTKKIIHVNVNVIRHNKKHGNNLPPCRVQEGNKSRYCREVQILGPSKMVYSPDRPLRCGAKLWIETESDVRLLDETPWVEIKEGMAAISK
jgi:ferredoxin-thioredoxin reductase catalytic subunit